MSGVCCASECNSPAKWHPVIICSSAPEHGNNTARTVMSIGVCDKHRNDGEAKKAAATIIGGLKAAGFPLEESLTRVEWIDETHKLWHRLLAQRSAFHGAPATVQ